ncbi:unnamed protein product [Amoebophrya sp. A120]|nr:unnamed protein product [Amoebophrya sp. A120]|eukprot:GSA120T00017324001.1
MNMSVGEEVMVGSGSGDALAISAIPSETYKTHPAGEGDSKECDWALNGFLIPHSVARMATYDLLAAVKALEAKGVSGESATLLKDWYKNYYLCFVHHHHRNEETIYFPWLSGVLKEKGITSLPPLFRGESLCAMGILAHLRAA